MKLQPIPRRLPTRLALTTALAASLALAACGQGPADDDTPPVDTEVTAPDAPETPAVAAETAEAPSSGTPAYAAAYPGAQPSPAPDEPATDLGGSVTFTTADSPEAVIDFYQTKARDSGLSTVSALKQGETQAYAAVDPEGRGATLRVVAAPAEDDDSQTQVSVAWTVAQ
jgi:hypothetical protein